MIRGKKGISPLLATVLLIGFTVALVGLLILWGRSYVEERAAKEDALAQAKLQCQNLKFSVVDTDATGYPNRIEVVIKNEGNKKIDGFMFRVVGDTGSAPAFEHTKAVSGLDQETYIIATSSKEAEIGDISDGIISVLPRIKVASGVYVPCSDKEKEARIL